MAALFGVAVWVGFPHPASGLTCGVDPNGTELAITTGWPEGAPHEHVIIATITDIQAEQGDASIWGSVLTVRIDAVLRGDLPLASTEVFNPPTGGSGWAGFGVGRQYLIAAHPDYEADDGRVSTWACAPNEEITSQERFSELVALAADPRLPNAAMPTPPDRPRVIELGIFLLAVTMIIVARRRISR